VSDTWHLSIWFKADWGAEATIVLPEEMAGPNRVAVGVDSMARPYIRLDDAPMCRVLTASALSDCWMHLVFDPWEAYLEGIWYSTMELVILAAVDNGATVAEVALYDEPMTVFGVGQLYNNGTPLEPGKLPGLKLYWKFDEPAPELWDTGVVPMRRTRWQRVLDDDLDDPV
jgi:hypothetical protein